MLALFTLETHPRANDLDHSQDGILKRSVTSVAG